jgi:hypothetical protein
MIFNAVLLGTAGLSVIFLNRFLKLGRSLNPVRIDVVRAVRRDGDTMAYLTTYIVPFLGLATAATRERAALAVFLAVVLVLYLRADLFYVNPLLAIVNYHVFEIEAGNQVMILISKRRHLRSETSVNAHLLGNVVALEAAHGSGRGR